MSALAFDTHKFVKDLTKAGMSDAQAEVLANHYASLMNDRLATKDDIEALRIATNSDLKALEERLNNKIMITVLSAQIVTIVTICTVTTYLLSIN